jgi:hypothetical protein
MTKLVNMTRQTLSYAVPGGTRDEPNVVDIRVGESLSPEGGVDKENPQIKALLEAGALVEEGERRSASRRSRSKE